MSASESERINNTSLQQPQFKLSSPQLRQFSFNATTTDQAPTRSQPQFQSCYASASQNFNHASRSYRAQRTLSQVVEVLEKKTKCGMPCSHRSGANLSGLIDQQPNLINTRGSFNAVYSEFNIRMMISMSEGLNALETQMVIL